MNIIQPTKGFEMDKKEKENKYQQLLSNVSSLIMGEPDLIANLANAAAEIKEVFGFFWVGFYLVKEGQLVLGPFQGPSACTRISRGRGVCGTSWEKAASLVVDNVHEFPGHIACSEISKSEIVVPIFQNHQVIGVLDIDSDAYATFDLTDKHYLEKLCSLIINPSSL